MNIVKISSQSIIDQANRKISANKDLLLFLGLSLHYPTVIVNSIPAIATAATDGRRIYWDEKFLVETFNSEGIGDVIYIQLHEYVHIALGHCGLRGKRMRLKYKPDIMAKGTDYAVALFLKSMGIEPIASALYDKRFTDTTAEEICDILTKETPEGEDGGRVPDVIDILEIEGEGKGEGEGEGKGEGEDEGEGEGKGISVEEKLAKAMATASAMISVSKCKGSEAKLASISNAMRHAQQQIDWRLELVDFMGRLQDSTMKRSYAKLTRRPIAGLIRPGYLRIGKPHIGVVLDTSESMRSDISEMLSELESLSQEGYTISIVCCDTAASEAQDFSAGQFMSGDLIIRGGGGSNLAPGFDAIMEDREVDAIVCLTDGYISLHRSPPEGVKVLFVLTPYSYDIPKSWTNSRDVSIVKKVSQ